MKILLSLLIGVLIGLLSSYTYFYTRAEAREVAIFLGEKRNSLLRIVDLAENSLENENYTALDRLNCEVKSMQNSLKSNFTKYSEKLKSITNEGESAYDNLGKDIERIDHFIAKELVEICPLIQS